MVQNKNYKRPKRQMPERQRQLISQKLKGHKKSTQHSERISMSMKNLWKQRKQASSDSTNQTNWL